MYIWSVCQPILRKQSFEQEVWKLSYSICMSIQSVCQPILHAYKKTEYDEQV